MFFNFLKTKNVFYIYALNGCRKQAMWEQLQSFA